MTASRNRDAFYGPLGPLAVTAILYPIITQHNGSRLYVGVYTVSYTHLDVYKRQAQ